jgi:hypothetical protein
MNIDEKERIQSITIFKPDVQDDSNAPIDEGAIENEETLKLQDMTSNEDQNNKN